MKTETNNVAADVKRTRSSLQEDGKGISFLFVLSALCHRPQQNVWGCWNEIYLYENEEHVSQSQRWVTVFDIGRVLLSSSVFLLEFLAPEHMNVLFPPTKTKKKINKTKYLRISGEFENERKRHLTLINYKIMHTIVYRKPIAQQAFDFDSLYCTIWRPPAANNLSTHRSEHKEF